MNAKVAGVNLRRALNLLSLLFNFATKYGNKYEA